MKKAYSIFSQYLNEKEQAEKSNRTYHDYNTQFVTVARSKKEALEHFKNAGIDTCRNEIEQDVNYFSSVQYLEHVTKEERKMAWNQNKSF